MKKILLIATGGTIASRETGAGLSPEITSREILEYVPEAAALCDIDTFQLFNLDSTNMNWRHWIAMADCIRDNYAGYDGFVITHGTDTMAYTSAALSYLVQKSPKPILLTGSQKSIYLKDTDARNNLMNAFRFACDDRAHGVYIVFDGKVIFGTRAKKLRTKSYNAFSSIDYPEAAVIRDGRTVLFVEETETDGPVYYDTLDPNVFVLKLVPGIDPGIFRYLKTHYDGMILESFGVGGIPCYGDEAFTAAVADWIAGGKALVMATQVTHEGSDMAVYQVGQKIKETYGLIEAYDMTIEAVLTKLMWVLGCTKDPERIRALFQTPIHRDVL